MSASVLIDPAMVSRNIARMHRAAADAGLSLRAHVKAHRTVEVARMQMAGGAQGIALAYAAQAAVYLDAGISNIAFVWPWRDRWRWNQIVAVAQRIAELTRQPRPTVVVYASDFSTITHVSEAAQVAGVELAMRVDVRFADRGFQRAEVAAAAAVIDAAPGVYLDGLAGYWAPETAADAANWRERGRCVAEQLVGIAAELRAYGWTINNASVHGTLASVATLGLGPDGLSIEPPVAGISEVCAGAYALWDGGSADIGACEWGDIAVRVRPQSTPSPGHVDPLHHAGCEWLPDVTGYPVPQSLGRDERVPGSAAEIFPAHICPVSNSVEHFVLVDGGGTATDDVWAAIHAVDIEPAVVDRVDADANHAER